MKEWWKRNEGNVYFALMLAIPVFGCAMVVYTRDPRWFVLLAPLLALMEGAFILIPAAWGITTAIQVWIGP